MNVKSVLYATTNDKSEHDESKYDDEYAKHAKLIYESTTKIRTKGKII